MQKVLVGISGGIDSAVAAAELISKGFHVEGLHIRNGFFNKDEQDVFTVAGRLEFPLHVIDVAADFKQHIIDYFTHEYLEGRTPNPCALCNQKIKFHCLLKEASKRNFDFVATGHYARTEYVEEAKGLLLRRGYDTKKDQSYFLFLLKQQELSRIVFPNGNKTKEEVKAIGRKLGLNHLTERESQEICFIPDNDYKNFIRSHASLLPPPGPIIDSNGKSVGKHRGIYFYTIGQRKGLNIASARPYYVLNIDPQKNEVIVGREEEQFFSGLTACGVTWSSPVFAARKHIDAHVRIRYRHRGADALISINASNAQVKFTVPQKAVSPGQAVVFYSGEYVIGGGWIEKGLRNG